MWNPFTAGFSKTGPVALNAGAGANWFQSTHTSDWGVGTPGPALVYDGTASVTSTNSGFKSNNAIYAIQTALDAAAGVYTAYDTKVTEFNTSAATYNTAVAAYNTALADGEKELPTVPEKPCAPTAPSTIDVNFVSTEAWNKATATASPNDTKTFVVYGDAWPNWDASTMSDAADAARVGILMSSLDEATGTHEGEYDGTFKIGHVFGRLGQGANNTPTVAAPWRWIDQDEAAGAEVYNQSMQISIFPMGGYEFMGGATSNTYTAFTADQKITITASEAALSFTGLLDIPAIAGTTVTTLTAVTGAQVLAASALVMATSIAAVY